MWPQRQKVCAPLRLLSETDLQPWALLKWLKGSTRGYVLQKVWKHKDVYHLYPEREAAIFKGIYKERESKLKPLHSQVCLFHLKYNTKKGEPNPWKCFHTCADCYPAHPCWCNSPLSFTFLSHISFFLMHLEQHQFHYGIQEEQRSCKYGTTKQETWWWFSAPVMLPQSSTFCPAGSGKGALLGISEILR